MLGRSWQFRVLHGNAAQWYNINRAASTVCGVSAPEDIKLLINGDLCQSKSSTFMPVVNPATQKVLARVPETTRAEFASAVQAAKDAFPAWSSTPLSERTRIMFKFLNLIQNEKDQLARIVESENGKTIPDAHGDVFRGIEVVEMACGMGPYMMGEFLENAAKEIDVYSIQQPLGVCAGICPFNFPAMVPLWMFPIAITAGNTFILKPSELVPSAAMKLSQLALQAGLPKGVLNVVHGAHDVVNQICTHPDISAVAFVGSDKAGQHVYQTACAHGKRVQANMGAKNHAIVMPDADPETTVKALTGAAFGAAGQRCMAISAAVFVGGVGPWRKDLVKHASSLKVNCGSEPGTDIGPLVTKKALSRAKSLIDSSLNAGAECILDGRGIKVEKYEDGNFLGPTVIGNVTADHDCYKEEVFGPVLSCLDATDLDAAVQLVNDNQHGNGTAIFTRSGSVARKFQSKINVGMVGINVPIPVPLPYFSFTGWRGSFHGDLHMYGREAVQFYTQMKTVTSRWSQSGTTGGKVPGLDKVGAS